MSDHIFAEAADGSLHLIGEWDALYSETADPWDQSRDVGRTYYGRSRERLAGALKRIGRTGPGLEVGCGHGHALELLRKELGVTRWEGMDISAVAVEQARSLYPNLTFHVGDIREPCPYERRNAYRTVILGEALWYVLERLDEAVAHLRAMLDTEGLLVVSQGFLQDQRYGRDICDGFAGTLRTFMDRYPFLRLVHAEYDDMGAFRLRHGVLIFRKIA